MFGLGSSEILLLIILPIALICYLIYRFVYYKAHYDITTKGQSPNAPTLVYCNQCGHANASADVYCSKCGNKLTKP